MTPCTPQRHDFPIFQHHCCRVTQIFHGWLQLYMNNLQTRQLVAQSVVDIVELTVFSTAACCLGSGCLASGRLASGRLASGRLASGRLVAPISSDQISALCSRVPPVCLIVKKSRSKRVHQVFTLLKDMHCRTHLTAL